MPPSSTTDIPEPSVANQTSGTALATATLRALAARDERDELRGPDDLAELFLPAARRPALSDPAARRALFQDQIAPGAYEFMLARTAYFDGLVRAALAQNLPQVVFLGAGYDTRPYRFRALVRDTQIFELDAGPTQRHKQAVLEQAGVPRPPGLTYVPIDLRRDALAETLAGAGFVSARAALWVWEGVLYYLPAPAVDATLAAIRAVAEAGSTLAFDYAALSPEALSEAGARQLREHLKTNHPAEPTRFGVPRGQLPAFLAARGYRLLDHLDAAEMAARYLTLRDGTRAGAVPPLFALACAAVAS